jgi:hypothetical protein
MLRLILTYLHTLLCGWAKLENCKIVEKKCMKKFAIAVAIAVNLRAHASKVTRAMTIIWGGVTLAFYGWTLLNKKTLKRFAQLPQGQSTRDHVPLVFFYVSLHTCMVNLMAIWVNILNCLFCSLSLNSSEAMENYWDGRFCMRTASQINTKRVM